MTLLLRLFLLLPLLIAAGPRHEPGHFVKFPTSDELLDCASTPGKVYQTADGVIEYCDPAGNRKSLSPDSAIGYCGDGVINNQEQCDTPIGIPGQISPGTTNCRQASDCNMTPGIAGRPPCSCPSAPPQECADGQITGTEVCDQPGVIGVANCTSTQKCATNCLSCEAQVGDVCNNGSITGTETCDARMCYGASGCAANKVCKSDCTACGDCGNGILDTGEQCDPGDSLCSSTDGVPPLVDTMCPGACTSTCTCPTPVCGNGIVQSGEECEQSVGGPCSSADCVNCRCISSSGSGATYQIAPGTTGNDNNSGFSNTYCTAAGVPNPCCTGSGLGNCTGPWRSFERALVKTNPNALRAGDTLELLDGTYDKTNNHPLTIDCNNNGKPDPWYTGDGTSGTVLNTCTSSGRSNCGTSTAYITIKARRPRKAVISADGSWQPMYIIGCTYYKIQDIVFKTTDNPAHSEHGGCAIGSSNCAPVGGSGGVYSTLIPYQNNDLGARTPMTGRCYYYSPGGTYPSCSSAAEINGSQFITLQGTLHSGNNRYLNAGALLAYNSADVLFDRVEEYNSSRNQVGGQATIRLTMRGSYGSKTGRGPLWDGSHGNSPGGSGGQVLLQYNGSYGIVESSAASGDGEVGGQVSGIGSKHYGLALWGGVNYWNARQYSSPLTWERSGMMYHEVENMLIVTPKAPSVWTAYGNTYPFFVRTLRDGKFRNLMVYDVSQKDPALRVGLYVDSYSSTIGDSTATNCVEMRGTPNGTPQNLCSITVTNSVMANASTPSTSTGINVADQASCLLDQVAVKNFTTAFAGQASSGCTKTDVSGNFTMTGVGLGSNECLVVPASGNTNDGSAAASGQRRRYCYGGSGGNTHAACTGDGDCTGGGTCQAPVGPDLACRYVNGVRQTGSAYDMWVSGSQTPTDCNPSTHTVTIDTVNYPDCNGRFYGCGPIVTGINDANNAWSCADHHERMGIRSDGAICPRPTCGEAAGATTTTTVVTTTTAAVTTTTVAYTAADDWSAAMDAWWTLDEASGTRANNSSTVCGSGVADWTACSSGVQITAEKKEGSASLSIPSVSCTMGWPPTCLKGTGNISVGGWVYPSGTSADKVLGSLDNDADPTGYKLYVSSGKVGFAIANNSTTDYCVPGSATVSANAWSHIAGTFDNTNNTIDTFTNGVSNGGSGSTCDMGSIGWTTHDLSYGIGVSSTNMYVDEAYATSVALTAAEHARIASCGVRGERCKCNGTAYFSCTTATQCGGAPAVCTDSQCRGYLGTSVTLTDCNQTDPTD